MVTSEERLRILQMIQEGKLTAEEGIRLFESLETATPKTAGDDAGSATFAARGQGRWFRVRVTDTNSGKTRVNLRMPISVVNAGLKMGMKFAPEVNGVEPEQLMTLINNGELGQIVDVYDEEDGEHVEVYIE